ncbi:MAG TPA: hypothetical protein VJT75_12945 [Thermoleophilaceae bacterium]|nr:hypothetical protein [Thermoleophilaceae bacterium]
MTGRSDGGDTRRSALFVGLFIVLPLLFAAGGALLASKRLHIAEPPSAEQGFDFDVDGGRSLYRVAYRMFLLNLVKTPGAASNLDPSEGTSLLVGVSACDKRVRVNGTVRPDARWWLAVKATREHKPLVVRSAFGPRETTLRVRHPQVKGRFGFSLTGDVRDFRARTEDTRISLPVRASHAYAEGFGPVTTVTGRIPTRALHSRELSITDIQGDAIEFSFTAPWASERGYQTCYVQLPALVDPTWATPPLARDRLSSDGQARARGPADGANRVAPDNLELQLDEAQPAPRAAGGEPAWGCARGRRAATKLIPQPDCHATLVLQRPNRDARLQLWVLISATLISGGLIGAAAGVRRMFWGQ